LPFRSSLGTKSLSLKFLRPPVRPSGPFFCPAHIVGRLGMPMSDIDDVAHIPLVGEFSRMVAVVDRQDKERVLSKIWHGQSSGYSTYAISSSCGELIGMHRFVLGITSDAPMVDHRNGDGLDNRRSNLRLCTASQNMMNRRKLDASASSKFKGVWLDAKSGKWVAQIGRDGDRIRLGTFDDEIRAALQYDRAARLMFGSFARTNKSMGLI